MGTTGLTKVRIRGFRTIEDVEFRPGRLSALVGEASAGKSNVLAAIRALLDPEASPLTPDDVARGGDGRVLIGAQLSDGTAITLDGRPPDDLTVGGGSAPPPLYFPAALRTGRVVARSHRHTPESRRAAQLLGERLPDREATSPEREAATEAARGLVAGLESCAREGIAGVVFLIEEPELFLPPQIQRYLYRLLRTLSGGNQVIYSTHSPAFLNVARLNELVITERRDGTGTRLHQPEALPADEEFRAFSEFDAERGELFLARAAVLVEGLTEKLALPFVFAALGHDPNRELISIVECGGKANIVLIARVSQAVGVPFLAVHDRDAPPGSEPSDAERQLNALIGEIAGDRRVELAPDFEGVAGLRGHRHKPARAWKSFADLQDHEVPAQLAQIVHRSVALARGEP